MISPQLSARRAMARWASAVLSAAEACGMPSSRCNATGNSGLGRPEAGQPVSVAPRNHTASNDCPAEAYAPITCTGASSDSGAKIVSCAARSSVASNSLKEKVLFAKSSEATLSSIRFHASRA
jgi:hypothetical protein